MTTLTITKKSLQGHKLNAPSPFPALHDPVKFGVRTNLPEDEGLFINYGMDSDPLPYTMQDDYDGPLTTIDFDVAVLENDHLKATFMLELGGRLWSLYDKDHQRDLLLDNHQFLPGNLAIRNAWFAGGVEWNVGRRGHDAQTCSPRFAAKYTAPDGSPVLRIYEMSRDRLTPFQLDFMLPPDSRFLLVRVRVVNNNESVTPMYWWSNIAVPQQEGCRVVVPTNETYANAYMNGQHALSKIPLPFRDGYDCTYPMKFPVAEDHFYKIPEANRKYETLIYSDGFGLAHCSTSRLTGRKLFVWGHTQGGNHFQRKLMAPDNPDYLEIQGGLAHTQQECLPMPPKTAWEWCEAYGAITVKPEDVFGTWEHAVETVTAFLDDAMPAPKLEAILAETKPLAMTYVERFYDGSGFPALEEKLRGDKLTANLDFGEPGDEQAEWLELLNNNAMSDDMPKSFMVQDAWFERLKAVPEKNWKVWYHLALNYFRRQDFERMQQAVEKSIALSRNAWNMMANAYLQRVLKNFKAAARAFADALMLKNDCISLAKDCLRALLLLKEYDLAVQGYRVLAPAVQTVPLVKYLYADALAHAGQLDEAMDLIMADGGLDISDIREGEISISELYVYIEMERAKRKGIELKREDVKIPYIFDFRMS